MGKKRKKINLGRGRKMGEKFRLRKYRQLNGWATARIPDRFERRNHFSLESTMHPGTIASPLPPLSNARVLHLHAIAALATLAVAVTSEPVSAQDGKSFATVSVAASLRPVKGNTFVLVIFGTIGEDLAGAQTIKIISLKTEPQQQVMQGGKPIWKRVGKIEKATLGKLEGLTIEWTGAGYPVTANATDIFSVATELEYEVYDDKGKLIKKETRFDRSAPILLPKAAPPPMQTMSEPNRGSQGVVARKNRDWYALTLT